MKSEDPSPIASASGPVTTQRPDGGAVRCLAAVSNPAPEAVLGALAGLSRPTLGAR